MRWFIASLGLAVACSSEVNNNQDDAELALVNAATGTEQAQLVIDGSPATLPAVGQSRTIRVASGTHELLLKSPIGATLASTSFSITAGARRAAVFTGSNATAVALSIASDTMSVNPGGGYHSIIGSILMVNSAQGVGPFDIVVHQVGSDSVYHFGSFGFGAGSLPPPAPYGFYIPFVPATYLIDITNPGNATALAHTELTLVTDDKWIVTLTAASGGQLGLQAVKQQ